MALARCDAQSGELLRGAGGYCIPSPPGEAGLMLTKISEAQANSLLSSRILRDVFSANDFWYSTGNLLRRDSDGDYWFVARTADLVRTGAGLIACIPVEDALYETGLVSVAAAYGVPSPINASLGVLVASIMPKAGHSVRAKDLDAAFFSATEDERPSRILVHKEIEMSDGFRPKKSVLIAAATQARDAHDAGRDENVLASFHYEDGAFRAE